MSAKKNTTQWFVEPMDEHTNGVISEMLAAAKTGLEQKRMLASDGKEHDVWECTYADITKLRRSKSKGSPLEYRLWKRDASYGSMQPAPDFDKIHRRKRRKTQRTARRPT
ncbi:MAG: hypothetical protein UX61_C0024G0005 [Parcubacteria group bacterium GW2011_GWA2_46_7]|nr:MAG: hypothetical protein UX61_C0024G0005 [Parcubacteria group bacterium GW2011_GWA2_46_7]